MHKCASLGFISQKTRDFTGTCPFFEWFCNLNVWYSNLHCRPVIGSWFCFYTVLQICWPNSKNISWPSWSERTRKSCSENSEAQEWLKRGKNRYGNPSDRSYSVCFMLTVSGCFNHFGFTKMYSFFNFFNSWEFDLELYTFT